MKTKYTFLMALGVALAALVLAGAGSAAEAPAAPAACVPGPHSGTIISNEAWCAGDNPHLINGNVTVAPGAILTIEAGVIVKTAYNVEIQVQGRLVAIGAEAQPILFTSQTDTPPPGTGPGQWGGIYFNGDFNGGTGDLRHVTVRYAGGLNSSGYGGNIIAKNVRGGEVRISDSVIRDENNGDAGSDAGLWVVDSRVTVNNTLFTGNGSNYWGGYDAPMRIRGASSVVTMTANSFTANINDRVVLDPGAMMGADARLTPQTLLPGYEMWGGNFIVPPTVTLTIEPGVTVFNNGGELQVQGRLNAIGTETQPILFTSVANTAPTQWGGIVFNGGAGDLRHVTVRYAGGANSIGYAGNIIAKNVRVGEVRISDSVIRDENSGPGGSDAGLWVVDSRVAVSNTLFTGNGSDWWSGHDAPMRIRGASSVVTMTANSFTANIRDRVVLDPGAMMAADARLTPQTLLAGYEMWDGDFTVPPTVTLTIEPGVTVFNNGGELQVQGRLNAIGTATQPITLTGLSGTAAFPWRGLCFNGGAGDLRHVTVHYGSNGNSCGFVSNVAVQNGEARISDSVISDEGALYSADAGLVVWNSRVVVSNTLFTRNGGGYSTYDAGIRVGNHGVLTITRSALDGNFYNGIIINDGEVVADSVVIADHRHGSGHGVYIDNDQAVFTMTNSTVILNAGDGVCNVGAAQVTLGGAAGRGNIIMANGGKGANQVGAAVQMLATYNWWGDISGPTHVSNPGGKGEEVSDRVLFDPWAVEAQGMASNRVYVAVGGARTAPPGGSVAHTVLYLNGRTETIADTVLELQLPAQAAFVSASHGGIYWPQRHEVVWRLGNLAPGASGLVAAQVRYAWGLSNGSLYAVQARLGGPALPLGLSDLQTYLDLVVPTLTGMTALTPVQFDAERAAYPALDALYTQALAAGFVDGGVVRLELDAGAPITQAVLLRPAQGEVRYVRRQGDQVLASTFAAQAYSAQTSTGGMTVDWRTDDATFTGAWGDGATPTPAGEAYAACRLAHLPGSVLDEKAALLAQTFASATCYPCQHGGACVACGAALQRALPLPEAVESLDCLTGAGTFATSATLPIMQEPEPDVKVICYRGWTDWWYGRPWIAKYQAIVGNRLVGGLIDVICDPNQSCKEGYGYYSEVSAKIGNVGCVCKDASALMANVPAASPLANSQTPVDSATCSAEEAEGISRCLRTEIFRPRDPNAKYGLEGDLVPGQRVTYTITYENEGAGRAYGVFITDKLDAAFDLTTLTIYGPGQLIPANRTLLWDIGELGPKGAPDSQGVVSFTVQLRADAPIGTAVINQATVYFPTVNEETPTNPVVNFVRPLAAIPQRLQTEYRQPVSVTLAGRAPHTQPLTFSVIEAPLNGVLSGAAPNLIYTPAENFTGLEQFTFTVSDGITESLPADVLIEVAPSAADTTAPQVIWVSPAADTVEVRFSVAAALTDTIGPLFTPFVQAQFSEALNATTVSTRTAQLIEEGGRAIPVSVVYDAAVNRAMLLPREALRGGTWYTATLTTGIHDAVGNALAQNYAWRFRTAVNTRAIYLPLVLRNK